MFSHYQHHATSFAASLDLSNSDPRWVGHDIVNALNRKADRLAPRFSVECSESSCTNLRPGADEPRRQQVWDIHAEALAWNLIADNAEVVAAALAQERGLNPNYIAANERDWDRQVDVIAIVVTNDLDQFRGSYEAHDAFRKLVVAHPAHVIYPAAEGQAVSTGEVEPTLPPPPIHPISPWDCTNFVPAPQPEPKTQVNPFVSPRPSWDEVMKPLADSPLWQFIRQAGSKLAENHLHDMGDYDSGISSSDVNHTIFGVASWVDRNSPTYPGDVLTRLVHEAY